MLIGILGGVWDGHLLKKRGLTLVMTHRFVTTCDEFECNFNLLNVCTR